ncbi:antibiotic biosynthesis monooxygenase [Candidatus Magnetomorum sp. HK-1]|nr:antibiotic biosynthesis monooxygenase [Candidatus Magnetomorum sp. HK-1]
MILVRIIMNVLPEKRKELIQTLLSIMKVEKNSKWLCLSYEVLCVVENTNIFNLISTWETRKHLENYFKSDRFSVLLGTKSLLCEPLDIQIFTISNIEGFEVVKFVRK